MDDATQKLVDGLRQDAGDYAVHMAGVPKSHDLSWDARNVRAWEAADALEAAQRPPVSGDYTHVVNLARASEAADKGFDALVNYLADLPTIEEWRSPVSPDVREGMRDALREAHRYDHDFDPEWDYAEDDDRYIDAILARFSVPSQPVYGEEAIAEFLRRQVHAPGNQHDPRTGECVSCPWPLHELPPEDVASALVAALRGGELTREETNRG